MHHKVVKIDLKIYLLFILIMSNKYDEFVYDNETVSKYDNEINENERLSKNDNQMDSEYLKHTIELLWIEMQDTKTPHFLQNLSRAAFDKLINKLLH